MRYSVSYFRRTRFFLGEIIPLWILLGIMSCKKDDEKDPESPPPVNAEIIEGNIDSPRVLGPVNAYGNSTYRFIGRTDVSATLTIEPGVVVLFDKEADLYIKQNGALKAIGSETAKIVFKGGQDTKGYWGGLYFDSGSEENNLRYCVIENAGDRDRSIPARTSAVVVHNGGRLVMRDTRVSKSGGYGIFLYEKASLPDFNNNTILESSTAPAIASLENISYFNNSNNFQGNTHDHVDTYNSYNYLRGDHIWRKLNVPYRLPGKRVDIEGAITVEAGASFIGTPSCAIRVQPGASFSAEGSSDAPIVFRGQEARRGFWGGFQFVSGSEKNVFRHVTLEHAGGSNTFAIPERRAGIEVASTGRLVIADSKISHSDGPAIRAHKNAWLSEIGNSYTDNERNEVASY